MKLILMFIPLLYCTVTAEAKCERNNSIGIKTYRIDLDLDPKLRFDQVTSDFRSDVLLLFESEKYIVLHSQNKFVGDY
jgi:hypothetical protein